MKVLTPGHRYELQNVMGGDTQTIQFLEKAPHPAPHPDGDGLVTINDGTTNEEVIRMLTDRMEKLQTDNPCRENSIVITNLEESLMWLEKRTAERGSRGVEGTHQS